MTVLALLAARYGVDRSGAPRTEIPPEDNWEQKPYMPYYRTAPWFEDGKPADLPEDFYSSKFLVDRMIDYLDADRGAAPFFAYVAFQAVHIPVQAPPEFAAHYEGAFDGTPVLLGCSDIDPHIPVERVHESSEVFRRMGAAVDERIYPRMGHTVNQEEIDAVVEMLRA